MLGSYYPSSERIRTVLRPATLPALNNSDDDLSKFSAAIVLIMSKLDQLSKEYGTFIQQRSLCGWQFRTFNSIILETSHEIYSH